jgi:hypothetical protein
MSELKKLQSPPLTPELAEISHAISTLAQQAEGNSLALLALLRLLEGLHREICEGLFQESLPNNRQALYALLRDIEAEGGWPYIYRLKLQSFLTNLEAEIAQDAVLAQE